MKKLNLQCTLLIVLFSSIAAMDKELFEEFKTLLPELQQQIMLCKDDIIFLSEQPMTLQTSSHINSIAINHDVIVHGGGSIIKIWDIHTGKFLRTVIDSYGQMLDIGSIAIMDNKIIVTLLGNIVRIYDLHTSKLLNTFTRTHRSGCAGRSLAVHNNRAIIGAYDGTTEIWDINTNKLLLSFTGNRQTCSKQIWSITIQDNTILTGSHNGTKTIWDHNGNVLYIVTVEEKYAYVSTMTIHNNIITTGLWDGTIEIWNAPNETDNHTKFIISTAACNNNVLLTGSADNTAKIWDLCTRKCIRTLAGPNGHTNKIMSVAINNEVAITGSHDRTIKIWPLFPDLKETPEGNSLLWIIHNIDILQCDFIQRAYATTITQEKFIIDLPKKLGVIEHDESPEQMDGRIFFTFPCAVREYLRDRLHIKPQEKIIF